MSGGKPARPHRNGWWSSHIIIIVDWKEIHFCLMSRELGILEFFYSTLLIKLSLNPVFTPSINYLKLFPILLFSYKVAKLSCFIFNPIQLLGTVFSFLLKGSLYSRLAENLFSFSSARTQFPMWDSYCTNNRVSLVLVKREREKCSTTCLSEKESQNIYLRVDIKTNIIPSSLLLAGSLSLYFLCLSFSHLLSSFSLSSSLIWNLNLFFIPTAFLVLPDLPSLFSNLNTPKNTLLAAPLQSQILLHPSTPLRTMFTQPKPTDLNTLIPHSKTRCFLLLPFLYVIVTMSFCLCSTRHFSRRIPNLSNWNTSIETYIFHSVVLYDATLIISILLNLLSTYFNECPCFMNP